MSLVPDYDDSLSSSVSEGDEEDSDSSKTDEKLSGSKEKLPRPNFLGTEDDPDVLKNSVFKNPFTEAENAKEAILQKHVKMVDSKDNMIVINGKKICWNYRKGRCRFGHNCKFAHDSDVQKTMEEQLATKQKQMSDSVVCQSQDMPKPTVQDIHQIQLENQKNPKRKKRPGLTQGLIPGKKVMKNYANQKF